MCRARAQPIVFVSLDISEACAGSRKDPWARSLTRYSGFCNPILSTRASNSICFHGLIPIFGGINQWDRIKATDLIQIEVLPSAVYVIVITRGSNKLTLLVIAVIYIYK